jgi:hypothetical protein
MGSIFCSGKVSEMGTIFCSGKVSEMGSIFCSGKVSEMGSIFCSGKVSEMGSIFCSGKVSEMGSIFCSGKVSELGSIFCSGKVSEMGSIFFLAICYCKLYGELWIFSGNFVVGRSVEYVAYFPWQSVCLTGAIPRCLKTLKEHNFARTCFCTCRLKALHSASNTPTVSP